MQTHVLAVDDDPAIGRLIADYLQAFAIRVTTVANGQQMRETMARVPVDLVLLDLRLNDEDGLRLAREIRDCSNMPIIVLTGLLDEADRVMSLELGADDYLTKPFSPRELLARIRALLRRSKMSETAAQSLAKVRSYAFSGWNLNVRLRKLTAPNGDDLALSAGEFSLLVAFLAAPHRILSRDELLQLTRLHDADIFDRSIDTQVARLRRKLREPTLIATERGMGYRFNADVQVVRGEDRAASFFESK